MGYSIDQLKKTGTLEGNDTIPVMQGGLTKQVAAGILDNAKIITAAGSQASGIIRREMTYILKNNSSAINFTLNNAVGKKVVNNDYSDDAATAAGWIIKVMNVSTRSHVVIVGSNSWDIAKNENMYFFWTGSAWTLHNARMNNLIVDGELQLPNAAAVTSLQATSKLAGLDANGKMKYTTPDAIKSALSLATTTDLSNYTRIKTLEVADTTLDSLKESLLSNIANFNNGEDILVIRGTQNRGVLKINKQSNIYFSVLFSSYYYSVSELRYNNGIWQDNYTLNNILENNYNINVLTSKNCNDAIPSKDGETRVYYVPYSGGLNKPEGIYNWIIHAYRTLYSTNKSLVTQIAYGIASALGSVTAHRTIYINNGEIIYGEWVYENKAEVSSVKNYMVFHGQYSVAGDSTKVINLTSFVPNNNTYLILKVLGKVGSSVSASITKKDIFIYRRNEGDYIYDEMDTSEAGQNVSFEFDTVNGLLTIRNPNSSYYRAFISFYQCQERGPEIESPQAQTLSLDE